MVGNLDKLYNAVSAKFDIGDKDAFSAKMQTPQDRKKFYDAVSAKGFDLGDYNSYEGRLNEKPVQTLLPKPTGTTLTDNEEAFQQGINPAAGQYFHEQRTNEENNATLVEGQNKKREAAKDLIAVQQASRYTPIQQIAELENQLATQTGAAGTTGQLDTQAIQDKINQLKSQPVSETELQGTGVEAGNGVANIRIKKSPYKTYGEMYDAQQQAAGRYKENLTAARKIDADMQPYIEKRRKESGLVLDTKDAQGNEYYKMNPMESFLHGAGESLDMIDLTFGSLFNDPNLINRLNEKYVMDTQISPKQAGGAVGEITQIAGGLVPLIVAGAIAPEGVGALAINALTFGATDYGAGLYESFAEGKNNGLSDEEALLKAKETARNRGVGGAVLGGTMPLQGAMGRKLFLNEAEKSAVKTFLSEQAVMVSSFIGNTAIQNWLDGKPIDKGVGHAGLSVIIIGTAMHGLANFPRLASKTKQTFENIAAKNFGDLQPVIDGAVKNGVLDYATAEAIQNKAAAFNTMPKDLKPEVEVEVLPKVMEIQDLERQKEKAGETFPTTAIEATIEAKKREIAEATGAPLTEKETKEYEKLVEKKEQKPAEGEKKVKLTDSEKDKLKHFENRIEEHKRQKKEPPQSEDKKAWGIREPEESLKPSTDEKEISTETSAEAQGGETESRQNIQRSPPETPDNTELGQKEVAPEGVKKTLVTTRAYEGEVREEVKKELEKIGLTRERISHEEAKSMATEAINNLGLETAYEATLKGDIEGGAAAEVFNAKLEDLNAKMQAEQDPLIKSAMAQEVAKILQIAGKKQETSGQFNSQWGSIYADSNFGYNYEAQVEQYKAMNKGEIPADVEAKFKELDAQLKEAQQKLRDFEQKKADKQFAQEVKAIEREVKRGTKRNTGRTLIAEGLDELASALSAKLSATGTESTKVSAALTKIGRGMIDEGLATLNNVGEKLAEYVKEKFGDKVKFEDYKNGVIQALKDTVKVPEMRNGELYIPKDFIKSLVQDGVNSAEELTTRAHALVKEYVSDVTERQVRDAISGYGKQAQLSKDEINKKLRELRSQARLLSALQDAENKLRPLKSGLQRDKASERVKELQQQVKDAMRDSGIGITEKTPEEKYRTALEAYKERLATNKKEYERRIKDKDYSTNKKEPLELDEQAIKLKMDVNKVKEEFDVLQEKNRLANRSLGEKAQDLAADVWSLPKSLLASIDLSAPLRQGAVLTVAHPTSGGKATVEMFKQAFSEKKANEWLHKLKASPEYQLIQDSKLYIAEPSSKLTAKEEQFMSNLSHKIPVLGKIVKGSERGYTGYLNKLRVDVFNNGADRLMDAGLTPKNNPEAFKAWADFVNNATGRGNLGALETSATALNTVFFSPRFLASRLNILNPVNYAKMPPEVRKMAMRDMITYIGFGTMVLLLAKAAGAEVEADPRSTDFGKIKIGNSRFDIWAGNQQIVRTLAQIIAGQKKTATGEIKNMNDPKVYKGETRADALARFGRTKLSPALGTSVDLLEGKDMLGNEVTVQGEAIKNVVPLYIQDVMKIYEEGGNTGEAAAKAIPAFFGVGVQTYDSNKKKKVAKSELF